METHEVIFSVMLFYIELNIISRKIEQHAIFYTIQA